MKRVIIGLFLVLTSLSFSNSFKIKQEIPENVEKEIRRAVSSHSSSEKREYFDWYKDSYLSMLRVLGETSIPDKDKEIILKRLHSMYGSNYPKQYAALRDEMDNYNDLVKRIRDEQRAAQQKIEEENRKSKMEIEEILGNSNIPKVDLENIELNAKKEFPENYNLQRAYIKGAIQTYLELKNMIKK